MSLTVTSTVSPFSARATANAASVTRYNVVITVSTILDAPPAEEKMLLARTKVAFAFHEILCGPQVSIMIDDPARQAAVLGGREHSASVSKSPDQALALASSPPTPAANAAAVVSTPPTQTPASSSSASSSSPGSPSNSSCGCIIL